MIEESRKEKLEADFEYYVNRYIDKQGMEEDIINDIAENSEERDYLFSLNACFSIVRQ